MVTLDYLLAENDIRPSGWPGERIVTTIRDSKRVRRDLVTVRMDTLRERDELYAVWCAHFDNLF
ncbi:hypothetical protein [Haloprofundus sp. MHR1]|uniref:hypothetical protein n=1 Tax=Haloprofundus sp. MHR1 TaxID=2572921 RepID=UPI0010BE57BE|nr:hypothetical protein [Haloprofundus sp. MHR1]QCJ47008.1 hypothetical protein FCF25_07735 [Haloprofundus sp. MHR1]